MNPEDILYISAGAVAGALLRYAVTGQGFSWRGLPLSVLAVNLAGSLALGAAMALVQRLGFGGGFVLLVGVGFCGSLTTMSSFAFETAGLMDEGLLLLAGAGIALNVLGSLASIFLGRAITFALLGGA